MRRGYQRAYAASHRRIQGIAGVCKAKVTGSKAPLGTIQIARVADTESALAREYNVT